MINKHKTPLVPRLLAFAIFGAGGVAATDQGQRQHPHRYRQ